MNKKKIIISLSVIGIVCAFAVGLTVSYFRDTETSTGNKFVAGKLNLKIDNTCHYNGKECKLDTQTQQYFWTGTTEECFCTWSAKDLTNELFFDFPDVKAGDNGEDTISLHVDNNDAWVCAELKNLKNDDNGCDNPENKVDTTCEANQGELRENLYFTIWKDNGAGSNACNNVKDNDENYILENQKAEGGIWPIADSSTGTPVKGGSDYCLGITWNVPLETSNVIQTDSLEGDLIFNAVQSRNMASFKCDDLYADTCDGIDNDKDGQVDENCELFFSEYVEGNSSNKALEIYNGSGAPINLGGYKIEQYFNGSDNPSGIINLPSADLNSGNVYVVCNNSAATGIISRCNLQADATFFDGDDAVVLKNPSNEVIDVIGKKGTDPGSEWGTGLASTQDNTLVRKCTINGGDKNGADDFDPSIEWDGNPTDLFTNLGVHDQSCAN